MNFGGEVQLQIKSYKRKYGDTQVDASACTV